MTRHESLYIMHRNFVHKWWHFRHDEKARLMIRDHLGSMRFWREQGAKP